MSRSIRNRHNKYGVIIKIGGNSDKKDKRVANRKFRRYSHIKLNTLEFDKLPHSIRDMSDTWNFRSDGLAHFLNFNNTRYTHKSFTKEEQIKYRAK